MENYSADKNYSTDEIDLRELFSILMDKLKWILFSGAVCAAAAFFVTAVLIVPEYESGTSVYILSKENQDKMSYNDLQASTMLAEDCTALVKSRAVAEEVIRKLSLDINEEELIQMISVSNESSSGRVIVIKVTHTDPAMAQRIADTVRETASGRFVETMDLKAVNVVDQANYPEEASNIKYKRNVAVGFAAGIFASAGIFIAVFLLSSKIRTQDDIEKYLGLSVLGVIPDSGDEKNTRELTRIRRKQNGRDHTGDSKDRQKK